MSLPVKEMSAAMTISEMPNAGRNSPFQITDHVVAETRATHPQTATIRAA